MNSHANLLVSVVPATIQISEWFSMGGNGCLITDGGGLFFDNGGLAVADQIDIVGHSQIIPV